MSPASRFVVHTCRADAGSGPLATAPVRAASCPYVGHAAAAVVAPAAAVVGVAASVVAVVEVPVDWLPDDEHAATNSPAATSAAAPRRVTLRGPPGPGDGCRSRCGR